MTFEQIRGYWVFTLVTIAGRSRLRTGESCAVAPTCEANETESQINEPGEEGCRENAVAMPSFSVGSSSTVPPSPISVRWDNDAILMNALQTPWAVRL